MTCFFETHGMVLKILKIFVPLPDVADSSEFTSHYPLQLATVISLYVSKENMFLLRSACSITRLALVTVPIPM